MDELTEEVFSEELKKFEKVYYDQLHKNCVTPQVQFEYAWCLVRSKYPADIKKGILFLEELCASHEEGQRDYLYYLAIGNARIKEYNKALKCVRTCLDMEPNNNQVTRLETLIKKRMVKEGIAINALTALALAGVATIAVVGVKYFKKYQYFT